MRELPHRLRLDDERRAAIAHELGALFERQFDEPLSDFRAHEPEPLCFQMPSFMPITQSSPLS